MATAALAQKMNIPGALALPRSISKEDKPVQDTVIITPEKIDEWDRPQFQRPLTINEHVIEMAKAMRIEAEQDRDRMCTIPGTLIFGRLRGETTEYQLDGQHRIFGAFAIACGRRAVEGTTGLGVGVNPECAIASIEIRTFETIGDMAKAFVGFQKKLVSLKPDDMLRALEITNPEVKRLRDACPFIGYEKNRHTKDKIMIAMSTALRTWFGSGATPTGGPSADRAAMFLEADPTETDKIIEFFKACQAAGWVDPDYPRLWGTLNLGINMWLWRRLVLGQGNKFKGGGSFMALSPEQYAACMTTLKTDGFCRFLGSKALRYQDRLPTYNEIQEAFIPALRDMKIVGIKFPLAQGWQD